MGYEVATLRRTEEGDESALVGRLRAGDADAFDYVVRTYSPRLLAVARRMLGRDEDAQDALQDAFLSAFRRVDTFEGSARISTWLHRIVVNACLMKLRTRRRKPEESIESLLPSFREDGHHQVDVPCWDRPVDEVVADEQLMARVRRCIDELPDRYRTVLVLRDVEDRSTEDVARALGTTANAVKIRLHRARQALRTLVAQDLAARVSAQVAN